MKGSTCRGICCCLIFLLLLVAVFMGFCWMIYALSVREEAIKNQPVNSETCGRRPFIDASKDRLFESMIAESDYSSTIKKPAKEGEFPWVGVLIIKNKNKDDSYSSCTVSLISHKHAITAAHCIREDYEWAVVTFGDNQIDSAATLFSASNHNFFGVFIPYARYVSNVEIHFAFSYSKNLYDLAILTFDYPIEFTPKIQPICLMQNPDLSLPQNAMTVGWGRYEDNYKSQSKELRMGYTKVWPSHDCNDHFEPEPYKKNKVICYGDKETTHTHEGDSGGPLLISPNDHEKWFQIGVNVFYQRDPYTQKHAVDVASKLDCGWIQAITDVSCI